MKNLQSIDRFGATDADNDDILFECFEDHEAFRTLTDFQKFLIIGRKGSGKTSIFKKLLLTKDVNRFTFGHTFSDYPWHFHDRQARIGVPEYDKYTHSWKYLILLTLSKIILNQDHSLPYSDESLPHMVTIEKFVVDSYGTRDPDVTQIFTPSKYLKLKPTLSIDFGLLRAGIEPEKVPMYELPTIVQEVNKNLSEHVLSCINPENDYFICFDQLDLGFNPQDPEYTNRLIGLLLACRDLNILAKEAEKHLIVAVFLRDDIYDTLHFEDKNKITENFLSMIEWDTPRTEKTLKGLMEKRFTILLNDQKGGQVKWEDVFDETKEMTGHQNKYQHIIDRTFLRPRDIIKFCNIVLSKYKSRVVGIDTTTPQKFENIDINNAKIDYSNYLMEELDDEIHKHIPKYKNYLELFKSIGVVQFSREELFKSFDEKKSILSDDRDPIDILKELFEFSVVGYYKVGGAGYGGSEYVFRYEQPKAQFDENAQKFRLHPGLMEVLGLKKFSWA